MASPAPRKQKKLRHTVHRPADSDQSIMPTASKAPRLMKMQGFASYTLCGVQERIQRFYRDARLAEGFVYNPPNGAHMALNTSVGTWAAGRPWALEAAAAAAGLLVGVALMPVLIFYTGVAALGRYEGASLGALYASLFAGLGQGSIASWLVFLGPYGFYLLFRALRLWWRAGSGGVT